MDRKNRSGNSRNGNGSQSYDPEETTMTNPILKEIYEIREEIQKEHQDDLTEYLRARLAETKASGHPIAKVKQRRIRRAEVASSDETK